MTYKDTITNIKDLKIYLKELLEKEVQNRESSRGTGVFLAERIQHYNFQCAEIHDPFETYEDDNKFNYCGAVGHIGVKQWQINR